VYLGGCAVDALRAGDSRIHQCFQHPVPDARRQPSVEPIVDGGVRTVHFRTIAPTATNFQNVQNSADNLSVALRFHATPVNRNERLPGPPVGGRSSRIQRPSPRYSQPRSLNPIGPSHGRQKSGSEPRGRIREDELSQSALMPKGFVHLIPGLARAYILRELHGSAAYLNAWWWAQEAYNRGPTAKAGDDPAGASQTARWVGICLAWSCLQVWGSAPRWCRFLLR
jgi:hypothetical protein